MESNTNEICIPFDGSYFTCSASSCFYDPDLSDNSGHHEDKYKRYNYNKINLNALDGKYVEKIRFQFKAKEHGYGGSDEKNKIRVSFHKEDVSISLNRTRDTSPWNNDSNDFWEANTEREEFYIDKYSRYVHAQSKDRLYQGEFKIKEVLNNSSQLQIGLSTHYWGNQVYLKDFKAFLYYRNADGTLEVASPLNTVPSIPTSPVCEAGSYAAEDSNKDPGYTCQASSSDKFTLNENSSYKRHTLGCSKRIVGPSSSGKSPNSSFSRLTNFTICIEVSPMLMKGVLSLKPPRR